MLPYGLAVPREKRTVTLYHFLLIAYIYHSGVIQGIKNVIVGQPVRIKRGQGRYDVSRF